MVALSANGYFSPEDYLERESRGDIKHEYIDGQIYAMAGATKAHNIICLNLALALKSRLIVGPCQIFMADIKVMLLNQRRYFYPDLIVTCDDDSDITSSVAQHPRIIIEVLSDSTEGFDRGKKFQDYRTLPSLQAYILVNAKEYLVECFQRTPQNFWLLKSYEGPEAIAKIDSLNLEIPLAEIYATVNLPELVEDIQTNTDRA